MNEVFINGNMVTRIWPLEKNDNRKILCCVISSEYTPIQLYMSMWHLISECYYSKTEKLYLYFNSQEKKQAYKLMRKILKDIVIMRGGSVEIYDAPFDLSSEDERSKFVEITEKNKKHTVYCDVLCESQVEWICKKKNIDKIFYLNQCNPGAVIRHCGTKWVKTFNCNGHKELKQCPSYAKHPPAGICLNGALAVMTGEKSEYKCRCNEIQYLTITQKAKTYFDAKKEELSDLAKLLKEYKNMEKMKTQQLRAIVRDEKEEEKRAGVILFGAPSIGFNNLLLAAIASYFQPVDIYVEDVLPRYLYNPIEFDAERVKVLYKSLENKNIRVLFASDEHEYAENLNKWVSYFNRGDIERIAVFSQNNSTFGITLYDLMHLACMGAAVEKMKNHHLYIHAYNERAIHLFREKIKDKIGYTTCHGFKDYGIRFHENVNKEYDFYKAKFCQELWNETIYQKNGTGIQLRSILDNYFVKWE